MPPCASVGDKTAQERFGEGGALSDLKHEVESTMKYHWCARREQRIAQVICERCKHYSTKDQRCNCEQKQSKSSVRKTRDPVISGRK
ncbi:MAG: hypothetical protein QXT73_08830 [Candidatus Methanomethylicaceae archaeon]